MEYDKVIIHDYKEVRYREVGIVERGAMAVVFDPATITVYECHSHFGFALDNFKPATEKEIYGYLLVGKKLSENRLDPYLKEEIRKQAYVEATKYLGNPDNTVDPDLEPYYKEYVRTYKRNFVPWYRNDDFLVFNNTYTPFILKGGEKPTYLHQKDFDALLHSFEISSELFRQAKNDAMHGQCTALLVLMEHLQLEAPLLVQKVKELREKKRRKDRRYK